MLRMNTTYLLAIFSYSACYHQQTRDAFKLFYRHFYWWAISSVATVFVFSVEIPNAGRVLIESRSFNIMLRASPRTESQLTSGSKWASRVQIFCRFGACPARLGPMREKALVLLLMHSGPHCLTFWQFFRDERKEILEWYGVSEMLPRKKLMSLFTTTRRLAEAIAE